MNIGAFDWNLKIWFIQASLLKGLDVIMMNKTSEIIDDTDKPLKTEEIKNKKVDINVLKARAQAIQDKEYRKNTFYLILFVIILGVVGIYFST